MKPTRNEIWEVLVELVTEISNDMGLTPGELSPDVQLVANLGFSSVDIIHMMISVEDRFQQGLDLDSLVLEDGNYAEDLSLGELHDFVCRNL